MFAKSMIAAIALVSSVSFAKGHQMKQDFSEVMDKCQSDISTVCPKVKGKGIRVFQCLDKKSDKITSADCKDAVAKMKADHQAKKAAKPGVEAAAPASH